MDRAYERLLSLTCDLSEISNWAEKLLDIKEGETEYVIDYEFDGEQCQDRYDLKDGRIFYADIADEILARYSWKHAENRVESGEPPRTVALVVACGLASLVMTELIRSVDALPASCVWRDSVRRDLRLRFIEVYPFSTVFILEAEQVIEHCREFLETVIAICKEFGIKLGALAELEDELADSEPGPTTLTFELRENDYGLLRAMKELGADLQPKPALDIMQKAERTGYGKHAFIRLLSNKLARSTPKGYLLTPLGLATANGS